MKNLYLKEEHRADLKKSGLSNKTINQQGLKSLTEQEVRSRTGLNKSIGEGYIIPYAENETSFAENAFNIRLDQPLESKRNPSKTRRYMHRLNESTCLFIPIPVFRILDDNKRPLIIVEGEKKALKATQEGFPTIAVAGVWNWSSQQKPLKDFDRINLKNRTVYIAYDADKQSNPNVALAESRLAQMLIRKGAKVKIINLPTGKKLDDFLVEFGKSKLRELIDSAEDFMQTPGTVICANENDIRVLTNHGLKALYSANQKETKFYIYGGMLIRVEFDKKEGKPINTPLTLDRLRHHLVREALWVKIGKEGEECITKPSDTVLKDILATPQAHIDFPVLEGIVETPVFAKDYHLQAQQGYNEKTRRYLHLKSGLLIPNVSQKPSLSDIAKAKSLLCDELLGDYKFRNPSDKAHAIAMILLPFARPMIKGPTPLHLIVKSRPGVGASKMARCVSYIISGRDFSVLPEGENNEEWRKRITAAAMNGPQMLVIDNVCHKLSSAALSSALTVEVWADRILGKTEYIYIPINCMWVATGNNPVSSNEIARRMVRIEIYALEEKPYLRKASDFKHPDLEGWVLNNRGLLIWACCTLIQAWIARGCVPYNGNKTFGMFEQWTAVMGGILNTCGIPGFLEDIDAFHEAVSQEEEAEKAFVLQWFSKYKTAPRITSTLLKLKESNALLDDEHSILTQKGRETRFGKILHKMVDKTFEIKAKKSKTLTVAIEKTKIKLCNSTTWCLAIKKMTK